MQDSHFSLAALVTIADTTSYLFPFLDDAMCPFGVTPFPCFDFVFCPTKTLKQYHLLEYRVIEDTTKHLFRTLATGKDQLLSLVAKFWKRRWKDLVEDRNSLKDEKRRPMYRKVSDVSSKHHCSNHIMAGHPLRRCS